MASADGKDTLIGAVIEHIELAGTHSGDASMVIPAADFNEKVIPQDKDYSRRIARALNIKGPFNIQFLVKTKEVFHHRVQPSS